METKVIKINKEKIEDDLIHEGASIIRDGGLVAFPTETVYGLGANGLDEKASQKIFVAKGRPQDNPLILHVHSIEQVKELVLDIPEIAIKCMEKFWPGPLTLLLKKSSIVPNMITAGLDSVAIRMPNHPIALKLIKGAGVPIAAPSANLSGKPSPTNASHVIEDLEGKINMIIDGGDTGVGLESTVLDLSTDTPMILRPGGVTLEDLKEIIPNISQDITIINQDEKIVPKSPGQKYRHYAPKAEMLLFSGDMEDIIGQINIYGNKYISEGKKVGIMATEETKESYEIGIVKVVGSRTNKETIAHNLFNTIRSFDEDNVDIILAEGVDLSNIGMAIMNRMIKAAGGKIIKV